MILLHGSARRFTGHDPEIAAGGITVEAGFQCAGCGEWNATVVDETAGQSQSYVEDCQVCCRPNLLHVSYDSQTEEFVITAELE